MVTEKVIMLAIFSVFLISACDYSNYSSYNDTVSDSILSRAKPYTEKIIYEDINLRSLSSSIVAECPSGDKECHLNSIYGYIVSNFKYYTDPRSNEFIQSPQDTINVMGGDCEDLTILQNSLLENIGIKTYIVLTGDHAYSLACGINVNKLWAYIKGSMVEIASLELGKEGQYQSDVINEKLFIIKEENQTIALPPENVYYFGGDGSKFSHPFEFMNIKYKISSSRPVTIHFVPSKAEYEKILDRESFSQYISCQKNNLFEVTGSCDSLKEKGGIILINSDNANEAKVDMNLKFYYSYSNDFSNNNISYYHIKEDDCVVLDATAGKYGYPGYDANLAKEKIAIDSMSQEYYHLN